MAREVEADLVVNDDTGKGLAAAERKIRASNERMQRDQERSVKRQEDAIKRSLGAAGRLVEGLNTQLKALHLDQIDIKANPREAVRAIEETQAKLHALASDATTVEVKIRTERALGELARFKKRLGDVGDQEGPQAAKGFLSKFADTLSGIPLPGSIAGYGAVIGAAMAPFLGAAVSGAVIGGAGVGGVIGGVLLASRDARVNAAGKQLGERLLGSLEQDAAVFVQPVLEAVDTIGAAFDGLEPVFRNIFGNASRYVKPLTEGLVGFLNPVIRGFDSLVAKAGPVIEAIRQGFTLVGEAIGQVFDSLSDNGVEAAAAIYAAFLIVADTIRAVGAIINGLTEAFGWIIRAEEKLGLISDDGKKALDAFKAAGDAATGSGQNLNQVFQNMAPAADAANAALAPISPNLQDIAAATRAVYTANNDLFASETSVAQALANASKAIGHNRDQLRTNTSQGLKNREALSQLSSALQNNYDKFVQVNGVGPKSARVADNLRGKFIALAQKTGLSADAAKNLANKILAIPSSHDTKITAKNAQALEAAREVRRAIDGVHGKTVSVNVNVNASRLNKVLNQLARFEGSSGSSLRFDAVSSWAMAGGGTYRTGGPVQVQSEVTNVVTLDGEPFYRFTGMAIAANNRRERWRQRVGVR